MKPVLIAGAGFSGATLARILAEAGVNCVVVNERDHVAGNCHTSEDPTTGILVHRYGPHIFHTGDERVWQFVQRFGAWRAYRHRVRSTVRGEVYTLPINLHTINQFFSSAMTPSQARAFLAERTVPNDAPRSFEEQALAMVGRELYDAFLKPYTEKQWGRPAASLPASILKRLPLRFDYEDNYFHHPLQVMPADGYTAIVAAMLDHPGIETRLCMRAEDAGTGFRHTFYCGGLDRYFGYRLGHLGYRSLQFEEIRGEGDLLGVPVMNFPDADIPWTRMTEHRHLAPWREPAGSGSIVWKEFPVPAGPADPPYYPLRLSGDETLLRDYVRLAKSQSGVTFLGRLGTYSYIDMDVAIARAMETAHGTLEAFKAGLCPAAFFHEPAPQS